MAAQGSFQAGNEMQWLPEADEEKMQLGFRIIQNAFKNKVTSLENEIRVLRVNNEEHKGAISNLQKKSSQLEVELIESHQRSQQLTEENKQLINTLRRQIEKLERLKRTFVESLEHHHQDLSKVVEGEQDVDASRLYMTEDYLRGAAPLTTQDMSGGAAAYASRMQPDVVPAVTNSPQRAAAASMSPGPRQPPPPPPSTPSASCHV